MNLRPSGIFLSGRAYDSPSECPYRTFHPLSDQRCIFWSLLTWRYRPRQEPWQHWVLSSALSKCNVWLSANKLSLTVQKTKCMLIHSSRRHVSPLSISLNGSIIEQVSTYTYFGCVINYHLTWYHHTVHITSKVTQNINILRRMYRERSRFSSIHHLSYHLLTTLM